MKLTLIPIVLTSTAIFAMAQTGTTDPTPGQPGVGGGGTPLSTGTGGGTASDLDKSRAASPGARQARPVLSALDKNMDGELSAEEIAAAATSLKALDRDNDGKLSITELMPGAKTQLPEQAAQAVAVEEPVVPVLEDLAIGRAQVVHRPLPANNH
jgi:hypothetical protein